MNRTHRILRVLRWTVFTLAAVVGLANLLHRVVFPAPTPDPTTFPRAGDRFGSSAEGVHQEVVAVRDGWLVLRTELVPGAAGPPLHVHRHFAETFRVESGTAHLELPDGVVLLGPGETYRIPPGVPHRPFNPTTVPVVIAGEEPVMPQAFGACLAQIYPFLDAAHGVMNPDLFLRIASLDGICDTHPPDVPKLAQVVVDWTLVPFARAFGYRNYYPELALHPPGPKTA